jgi:hypothetical protein
MKSRTPAWEIFGNKNSPIMGNKTKKCFLNFSLK